MSSVQLETLDPNRLLAGIRVIELCDDLGEYGGRLLAGLGAEVTHVFDKQKFGGHFSGRATYHNFGKHLVVRELGTAEGREQVAELIREADILLQYEPYFSADALEEINS